MSGSIMRSHFVHSLCSHPPHLSEPSASTATQILRFHTPSARSSHSIGVAAYLSTQANRSRKPWQVFECMHSRCHEQMVPLLHFHAVDDRLAQQILAVH